MALIDAYAHVGAPRFLMLDDYRAAMARMGVGKAMICPFENCADLVQVHAALDGSDTFRAFGLAMGRDRAEAEAGIAAQLEAGFEGFRVSEQRLAELPGILDVIGAMGGTPMVVGSNGLAAGARSLVDFLDRWPDAVVVSPHFAGPTRLSVFDENPAVAALFDHPNFYVVFSRQTLFDPAVVEPWARHVAEQCGWRRILWGSELPVPFWRDEKLQSLVSWIDRLAPSADQLAALQWRNAQRAVFDRPARPIRPLKLPFDPRELEVRNAAPMWPFGFPADTRLPARLVGAWMKAGGEDREPLSAFASALLLEALDARRDSAE